MTSKKTWEAGPQKTEEARQATRSGTQAQAGSAGSCEQFVVDSQGHGEALGEF